MTLPALQDLFRRYREKATGVWTLGKDPGRAIYFDYGDTVFATSTHMQDRLTYLLVEKGKVTQAQMDYALANLKPGLSIGKNLIEMGFITQRDLLDMAKAQVERIIRGALACPDLEPVFEARELDANVVRLPLNTPQLLLGGILALQDREALLELLGPLNQVVVLQGRNLLDLSLPPDLAKLPPLLDGTHTLLELSREAMAEPLRLGAFALFLREMGWARLHEMPPLDHQALAQALEPEATPTAPVPTLEEPAPEAAPSLFTTIQEAARPTTNLEHLSQSLDEPAGSRDAQGSGEGIYLPEALGGPMSKLAAEPAAVPLILPPEPGPGSMPTPNMPIRAVPLVTEDAPMPMVVPTDDRTPGLPMPPLDELLEPPPPLAEPPEPEPPALAEPPEPAPPPFLAEPPEAGPPPLAEPPEAGPPPLAVPMEVPERPGAAEPAEPSRRGVGRWILAALLVVAGLVAAVAFQGRARSWFQRLRTRPGDQAAAPVTAPQPPPPAPEPAAAPAAQGPGPTIAVPTPAPAAPAPAPAAAPAPAPEPAPEPPARPAKAAKPAEAPISTTAAARTRALVQGDLDLAVQQGRRLIRELPPGHFALRLEIACQGSTIQQLMGFFKGQEPDVFLLPITLRDGRACYQVLYGRYPTLKAAQKAVLRLPRALHADRNQPRIFRIADLAKMQ